MNTESKSRSLLVLARLATLCVALAALFTFVRGAQSKHEVGASTTEEGSGPTDEEPLASEEAPEPYLFSSKWGSVERFDADAFLQSSKSLVGLDAMTGEREAPEGGQESWEPVPEFLFSSKSFVVPEDPFRPSNLFELLDGTEDTIEVHEE